MPCAVLRAFPFLEAVWVDVSTPAALAAAPAALQQLADSWPGPHSSSSGGSSGGSRGGTGGSSSSGSRGGGGAGGRQAGEVRRLEVELVGVPRCYHCHQVRCG